MEKAMPSDVLSEVETSRRGKSDALSEVEGEKVKRDKDKDGRQKTS